MFFVRLYRLIPMLAVLIVTAVIVVFFIQKLCFYPALFISEPDLCPVILCLICGKCRAAVNLAERIGITQANLSILKTGKARAIRFSTLEAICKALDCQPGDILEYRE